MGPVTGPSAPLAPPAAPAAADQAALRDAARAFEALMLQRILATARPAASGPLGDAHALAEQTLATQLAGQDLFGLVRLLETRR